MHACIRGESLTRDARDPAQQARGQQHLQRLQCISCRYFDPLVLSHPLNQLPNTPPAGIYVSGGCTEWWTYECKSTTRLAVMVQQPTRATGHPALSEKHHRGPSVQVKFLVCGAEVAEQEALVAGVCSLLSQQPFYRASARSPTALAALITALLGSAGHQSPKAAQVIASMFITFSVGFIRPPALSYAQVAHSHRHSTHPLVSILQISFLSTPPCQPQAR